jgi:aldose 1-epimerase
VTEGTIDRVVLEDGDVSVSVLSMGAAMQDWRVPLGDTRVPVILGYEDPEAYRHNPAYLGVIVGRVANRIGQGRFVLNGTVHELDRNDGLHTLHGGTRGLGHVNWHLNRDGPRAVQLTHVSPDGDMGFPGRVAFDVTIALEGRTVTWDMSATVDRPTPISLAQHNYYNLTGRADPGDHTITVDADRILDRNADGIMTGAILPLDQRPLDLRHRRGLGRGGDMPVLDDFYVFSEDRLRTAPVATINAPNGLSLGMWSDQPGAQVYTGHWLPDIQGGLDGRTYSKHSGFCVEPSGFPNALNIADFPSVMAHPETPYKQRLVVQIGYGRKVHFGK